MRISFRQWRWDAGPGAVIRGRRIGWLVLVFLLGPRNMAAAQIGACCFQNAPCENLSGSQCFSLDGAWAGPGTHCDTVDCVVPPHSACCIDDACIELPIGMCFENNGAPAPPGSTCGDVTCEANVRACCVEATCFDVPPLVCASENGMIGGPGSSCDNFPCVNAIVGACCVAGECSPMGPQECFLNGGLFGGPDSDCGQTDCPFQAFGACCLEDSCIQAPTMQCLNAGGSPLGTGTTCNDATCAALVTTALDDAADAVSRPSDPHGLLPFDPQVHQPVDLLAIHGSRWQPLPPGDDPFHGFYSFNGRLVRIDLVFAGLVNPPGSTHPDNYNPFVYGDRPVYGFVEIDVDHDVHTGGELDATRFRFLGNAVRFGGKPARPAWSNHVATSGTAFDGNFLTPPFVERHGEEFHIALLHEHLVEQLTVVAGDNDERFEEGECWLLHGHALHRAHGFAPFSFLGEFAPNSIARFSHDPSRDETTLSFLSPMFGELTPDGGGDSILRGLADLQLSASFILEYPTGLPQEQIILGWANRSPSAFVSPSSWTASAIIGTAYDVPHPSGEFFVWNDIFPNVVRGDVNGDGESNELDHALMTQFIEGKDGADGAHDGVVTIPNFPLNFSVFDVNHSGDVDNVDLLLTGLMGDQDMDGDIDVIDFGRFQSCFSGTQQQYDAPECALSDFDADWDVDADDYVRFEIARTSP